MSKIIDDLKFRLACWEAHCSLMWDFCSCCTDMLLLEPSKENNYIWVIADLSGYDKEDIDGAEQQLIAIEKDYVE